MNILHLEASTGWGGQEIRILQEAIGMRARGNKVVFAVMKGACLGRNAKKENLIVYEVNFHKHAWVFSLVKLIYILIKHQIDVLNTHSSLDAWLGGFAGRLMGKKIIRTRHLSTPAKKGWNSRILYQSLADFVVTTCEAIIEPLSKQSGKKKSLFRSIPTGVDPGSIAIKGVADFRKREFVVGTACFMRSWKGIEVFLQAASKLREIQWVIIGGGHAEKYRKLAAEMNLNDVVHFTGHLENPFAAIDALDVFLLLSTANEGVSQAILQAAFLEKPLIATPTGGLCEVCLDGITGIQVPPFQVEAVVNGVLRLQSDRALRQRMGKKARELVLERFTFQQTLDAMERVYQNILEKR